MDFDFTNETITVDQGTSLTVNATGALTLPASTTTNRPGSPATGMLRFNTSNTALEYWDGTQWVTNAGLVVGTTNQLNTSTTGETTTLSLSSTIVTPGTINTGTGLYQSVTAAVTAAGTAYTNATLLTSVYNSITGGTNGVAGVMLPVPAQAGQAIYVFNRDTTGQSNLIVYPNTGGAIGNTAVNTPATVPYGFGTVFVSAYAAPASSPTAQWYTLAPSLMAGTGISISPQLGNTSITTVLPATYVAYGNANGNMTGTANLTYLVGTNALYLGSSTTDSRATLGFGSNGYLQVAGATGIGLGVGIQNTTNTGYSTIAFSNDQAVATVEAQLVLNGSNASGGGGTTITNRVNEFSIGQTGTTGDTTITTGAAGSTIRFGVKNLAFATEYLRMTGTATASTSALTIPQFTTAGILRNNTTGQVISTPAVAPSAVQGQSANVNTANVEVIVQSLTIPAGNLYVGATFRITGFGYYSSTNVSTNTFTMRIGTTGTTADPPFVTTLAATGTTNGGGFKFEGIVTVLSTGTTGGAWGHYSLMGPGVAVSNVANIVQTNNTATTVNTTVTNILSFSLKPSAAVTTVFSIYGGYIEQVN